MQNDNNSEITKNASAPIPISGTGPQSSYGGGTTFALQNLLGQSLRSLSSISSSFSSFISSSKKDREEEELMVHQDYTQPPESTYNAVQHVVITMPDTPIVAKKVARPVLNALCCLFCCGLFRRKNTTWESLDDYDSDASDNSSDNYRNQ